ncbi:unnamed protein product, partial [Polarella glacialis]
RGTDIIDLPEPAQDLSKASSPAASAQPGLGFLGRGAQQQQQLGLVNLRVKNTFLDTHGGPGDWSPAADHRRYATCPGEPFLRDMCEGDSDMEGSEEPWPYALGASPMPDQSPARRQGRMVYATEDLQEEFYTHQVPAARELSPAIRGRRATEDLQDRMFFQSFAEAEHPSSASIPLLLPSPLPLPKAALQSFMATAPSAAEPPGCPPGFVSIETAAAAVAAAARGSSSCFQHSAPPYGWPPMPPALFMQQHLALAHATMSAGGWPFGPWPSPLLPTGLPMSMSMPGSGSPITGSCIGSSRRPRLWAHIYLHMQMEGFDLVPRLIGRGGCNMRKIAEATGSKIRIRGRGSGHLEIDGKTEAPTPLMVAVTTDRADPEFLTVKELKSVEGRYLAFCQKGGKQPASPCYSIGLLQPNAVEALGPLMSSIPQCGLTKQG